jgi:hypothetical protein
MSPVTPQNPGNTTAPTKSGAKSKKSKLPSLPVVYRSTPVLRTAVLLSVLLVGAAIVFWTALDADTRASFTAPQFWTLVAFVVIIVGTMMSLGLSSLTIKSDEVVVRNAFRVRHIPWNRVVAVSYNNGDSWPYLELVPDEDHPDGQDLMVLGIQRIQGDQADEQVAAVRALVAAYGTGAA